MLWVLVGLATLGCATRRAYEEARGVEYEIRKVKLEGVERFKKDEFLDYLNVGESPRILRFLPLTYWSDALIPIDKKRIVELYAAHGYYDARVEEFRPELNERRETVTVNISVDEGQPTRIRDIDFSWPRDLPTRPPDEEIDPKAHPSRIEAAVRLQRDDVFEVGELEDAAMDVQVALRSRGYPFAEVQEHATVNRDAKIADVSFEIVPGPFARIAHVRIKGNRDVPTDLIYNEISWAEGKPYSPKLERQIEQAIYGLQVFNSVSVRPDPDEPESLKDHRLDLVVEVNESQPQYVKVGGGIALEPNRWEQQVFVNYRHKNLYGRLFRFDAKMSVGYAELPALYNPQEHGPIFKAEPTFEKKGLLEKKLVWKLEPKFEIDVQQGYQFYSPNNRFGVSRFFGRFLEAGISHNLRFVDFFDVSPTLEQRDTILGLGFQDPYLLSFLQFDVNVFLTDRILQPRNGVVLSTTYDISTRYLGSQFDYHKVLPEMRAYWQAHERLQFALRLQTGLIFPFGSELSTAPIDQRLYLGGADSMRGWGNRRLSPQVRDCPPDESCETIPVGGLTSVLGNFEVRVRVWKQLYTVAFFDAGDVQPGVQEYRPDQWNYSAGPGLRYETPVGKLRVDVGFRLNQTDRFETEPIWALHLGLGESF